MHGLPRGAFRRVWIIVANSWMQTPLVFHIVGEGLKREPEIVDFWANGVQIPRRPTVDHAVLAVGLTGFLVTR